MRMNEDKIEGMRAVQKMIAEWYAPENNENMNDLYCTIEHIIGDMYDELEEE